MSHVDAKMVMALRKKTGAPMMICKAALQEASEDMDKAVDILRKKGLQTADAKSGRDATEGKIFSYVHHDGKLAVLAEIACETDFVARNEEFQQFGADLCLHIAAMNPACMTAADIDQDLLAKERSVQEARARETMTGKPDEIISKAVEGRMKSFLKERCLLDQPWVKGDGQSVEEVCKAKVGKIGENIKIRRFVRIELGG